MPFDIGKLKGFYTRMLKIAMMLTLVIALLLFIAYIAGGGGPIEYLGRQEFIMPIVFLILEYTGYMMLQGKFQPPVDNKPRQRRPPQKQPEQYKYIPVPKEIEVGNCAFCGKEFPLYEMREFKDNYDNAILICKSCIKKEGGR